MVLCKDCKWFSGAPDPVGGMRNTASPDYVRPPSPMRCTHEESTTLDYVFGEHSYKYASVMREVVAPCGLSGQLFEAKA